MYIVNCNTATALELILKEVEVSNNDKIIDTILEYDNIICLK